MRFLDYANRRIEHYIWAKKKLIALLNEQKQAVIHRAVTRGLEPSVRLKILRYTLARRCPGALGGCPVQSLRWVFKRDRGIMAADFRDRGVPLLRISCLACMKKPIWMAAIILIRIRSKRSGVISMCGQK